MGSRSLVILIPLLFASSATAQNPQASWEGLSGLLSAPSARVLDAGHYTASFSEHRHQEYMQGVRLEDRFILGTANFGFGREWEMSFGILKELIQWGPLQAQSGSSKDSDTYFIVHFKRQVHQDRWGGVLSIGMRDVLDCTRKYRGYWPRTGRGRKAFLVYTRPFGIQCRPGGCPCIANVGITYDRSGLGGFLGIAIPVIPEMQLVAEVVNDSTFHDFEDAFSANPQGETTVNLGVRFLPTAVPGMTVDITSLGDSDFSFAFGLSYGK